MTQTEHRPVVSETLPRAFKLIRMHLAREPKYPNGDPAHGYYLIAPLDAHAQIDPVLWKEHREACKVVRFRPRENVGYGRLIRKGKTWAFHYGDQDDNGDDTGYRFSGERFVVGEYISIREQGTMHTFKITSVDLAGHWR